MLANLQPKISPTIDTKPATQSRRLGLSPGAMGGRQFGMSPGAMGGRAAPPAPTPDFLEFEQDRTISAPPKREAPKKTPPKEEQISQREYEQRVEHCGHRRRLGRRRFGHRRRCRRRRRRLGHRAPPLAATSSRERDRTPLLAPFWRIFSASRFTQDSHLGDIRAWGRVSRDSHACARARECTHAHGTWNSHGT